MPVEDVFLQRGFTRIASCRPYHAAILSTQAFIRAPQTDANSDPVTPPSGRHVRTPSACLCLRACSPSRSFPCHTLTQNPLCLLTDRNYRLLDITDFISNACQETGSPLMAGCWQGTHTLFTNRRGVCPAYYGYDMDDFEGFLNGLRH